VLHNPAGRILIQQYRPIFTNMVEREDRLRAIQRGHALVWAARAYALDHQGELPPSAGDLVPDYIDHLPDDPFADAPLQMEGDQVFSAADRKERIVAEIASLRWSITPPTTVEAD
jgi:hypothetical protein